MCLVLRGQDVRTTKDLYRTVARALKAWLASDGAVAAAHYGKHAYVQWSVEKVWKLFFLVARVGSHTTFAKLVFRDAGPVRHIDQRTRFVSAPLRNAAITFRILLIELASATGRNATTRSSGLSATENVMISTTMRPASG